MYAKLEATDGLNENYVNLVPLDEHIGACIVLLCVRLPSLLFPSIVNQASGSLASLCQIIVKRLVEIFLTLDYNWKFLVRNVKSEQV
jgi:hypothetical protein